MRQDKARQGKTGVRKDKTSDKQGKRREEKTRQDKTRQDKTRQVRGKANDCEDGARVGIRVRKYVLAKMTASLLDPG